MHRTAVSLIVAATLIVLSTLPCAAQYRTPGGSSGLTFQPFAFELGDVSGGAMAAFIWSRYSFTQMKTEYAPSTPDWTVNDFYNICQNEIPWLFFNSHGGTIIEVYSPDQLAARNRAYDDYMAMSYDVSEVYRGTMYAADGKTAKYYVIGVTPTFVSNYYNGDRSVVHFNGCRNWSFKDAFISPISGMGASAFLAYDYDVTNGTIKTEANSFYSNACGVNGQYLKRPLQAAVQGLVIKMSPTTPNIVMTPRVKSSTLAQGAHFTAAQSQTFEFDTPMNTTGPMSDLVRTEGGVKFDTNSLTWVDPTRLRGTLRGTQKDLPGKIVLSSYDPDDFDLTGLMSDTGIGLDGNTDPYGNTTGGELPAGDDYQLDVTPDYTDNARSLALGFNAVIQPDSILVRLTVLSESGTDHYLLEAATDALGPYTLAAEFPATGSSVYQVTYAKSLGSFVRWRTVETNGDTLPPAYTVADDAQPVVETETIDQEAADRLLVQLQQQYGSTDRRESSLATGPFCVIYSYPLFVPQAQVLANYKTNVRGIQTVVVNIANIGWAAGIKPSIAGYVATGARSFILLGGAEEEKDAQGNLRYGNPAVLDSGYVVQSGCTPHPSNNLIPTYSYPIIWGAQATSMPYWDHYVPSDYGYIDLDGDELPDPGLAIGRLPADSLLGAPTALATNMVNKQIYAYELSATTPGINSVFFFVRAWDEFGNSGQDMEDWALRVRSYFPSWLSVDYYIDKPTHWYSGTTRDALAITALTKGSGFQFYKSTGNNWYHDAGCLDLTRGASLAGVPNDKSRLTFQYVSSCGGGASEKVNADAIGRTLGERLMGNMSTAGTWGYYGPGRASWQNGMAANDTLYLQQLFVHGARSNGHAAAMSAYLLGTRYPQYHDLAISMMFHGDPDVPQIGQVINTAAVGNLPLATGLSLSPPAPNPSRGSAAIRFTLPTSSRVDISVHDVMGRRLQTVVSGTLMAGQHSQSVRMNFAPGGYFVRMVANGQQRVQKMVVIR